MPEVALDHVVIAVSDWARSNRFYTDVLGAELVDLGAAASRTGSGPGSSPSPRARDPVRPGNSDLCFVWVGSAAAAAAHLRANGVAVEEGPVERVGVRGNGTSVYFRDPDG